MKAVAKRPHTDGKGLARFDRKVEKPVAKPDYAGRTLGNMTGGEKPKGIGAYTHRTHRRGLAMRASTDRCKGTQGPCSSALPRR